MEKRELAKIKRRVKALQKGLGELGPVMRGSVVIIGTRNKQPYLSLNKNSTVPSFFSCSIAIMPCIGV